MEFSKEQRRKILHYLPEDIKSVFWANETTDFLIESGEKYGLSPEEQENLGEATGLVLLGILNMKEFQERLHEKIDGPEKQINKLVREVQENIFQPIVGSLKRLDPEAILAQIEEGKKGGDEENNRGKEDEKRQPALDIPIPQPPGGGDTPSPSYGGTSDPYREPTDD